MGYSQENGYVPVSVQTIIDSIMVKINVEFGTTYTSETFVGTNFYKYFYALAQRVEEGEIKTSEVFIKLQQYIDMVNARISRPVNTNPGIIDKLTAEGYTASVKPMIDADAGKSSIAIDVDDGGHAFADVIITVFANLISGTADIVQVAGVNFTAQAGAVTPGTGTFQAATSNNATAISLAGQINSHATTKAIMRARAIGDKVHMVALHGGTAMNATTLTYTSNGSVGATISGATFSGGTANAGYAAIKAALGLLISQMIVGGVVTQGNEVVNIVLTNGQAFDFKYFLPNKIPIKLRLTITLSENNQIAVGSPDDTKVKLLANINSRYRLGRNFEPQRYFSIIDAPWAAVVLLEWSQDDGATWNSTVYNSEFDDLFTYGLADITLVEV